MKIVAGLDMLSLSVMLPTGELACIHPTLIYDDDSVILVDTGYPGQVPGLRAAIEKAGLSWDSLTDVIITHHDMDHIGSLASLLQASDHKVKVSTHKEEVPYLKTDVPPIRMEQMESYLKLSPGDRSSPLKDLVEQLKATYRLFKVEVDRTLADGEVWPAGGGITIIHTPGHTPGHISLYLKKSKLLIAGDAMFVENGILVSAPDIVTLDKDDAQQSLQKLTHYDIDSVICYHGGLFEDKVNQRIAELAASL